MVITPVNKYNLEGKEETFFVTFKNPEYIKDKYDNSLQTRVISASAKRLVLIQEYLSTAGDFLSTTSYITLICSVLLSMKSNPAFWVYISMMQILSYIPLIDVTVPGNYLHFVKEFFGVSKASIPFDSFPDWVPNPKGIIEKFNIPTENVKALEAGYVSISFLYNFGYQLFTWTIMLILYLVFTLLTKFPVKAL